jgi:hypothetical protein
MRDAVRATRNRPTVAVYYPSADDPYFIENLDDADADDGGIVGGVDLAAGNHHDITDTNNGNQLSNYQVSNEVDSWGRDIEVDWDGASCRCHQDERETNNNTRGHRRRTSPRQQQTDHYHRDHGPYNNSNDNNNAVGMFGRETDTSGPSSSTVAFYRGFRARRSDDGQQQSPQAEEEDDVFAWDSPPSSQRTTTSGSARRPVTRSMSRGL